MPSTKSLIPVGKIEQRILLIRGERVIVDADLAEFYGVPTKVLNQAVRRNKERFPKDFMFRLSKDEKAEVVTICDHLTKLKFSPVNPRVFTEHGAIMAASVLNSRRAIQVSVFIVRAFVKLRRVMAEHKELAQRIAQLERRLANHDEQILSLVQAIRQIVKPTPLPKKRRIGFNPDEP